MKKNEVNFPDLIAKLCFDKYKSLSKNGKPVTDKEWTLLAGFVVEVDDQLQVVSLATGTKCIGQSFMTSDGTILNDSHAEVLARRCLLRFFYHELQRIRDGGTSKLFTQHETDKYKFEIGNFKLHMFASHVPCGDASILLKEDTFSTDNNIKENIDGEGKTKNEDLVSRRIEDYSTIDTSSLLNIDSSLTVPGEENSSVNSIVKRICQSDIKAEGNSRSAKIFSSVFNNCHMKQFEVFRDSNSDADSSSTIKNLKLAENSNDIHVRNVNSMSTKSLSGTFNLCMKNTHPNYPRILQPATGNIHTLKTDSTDVSDESPKKKRKKENVEDDLGFESSFVGPENFENSGQDSLNSLEEVSNTSSSSKILLDSIDGSKTVECLCMNSNEMIDRNDLSKTNDTFLNCCDEIQGVWESSAGETSSDLRNSLQKSGNVNADIGFCNEVDAVGKIVPDIHRTGAKCLPNTKLQDAKDPGIGYHVVGVVRTKPGRGDPTLSVSCSDKIARWVAAGVQGALLSTILEKPIHLSSISVGGGGPYSAKSMFRALILRSGTSQRPLLYRSSLVFESSRYLMSKECKPCSSSIMWTDIPERPCEVSAKGYRLGATKAASTLDKATSICRRHLYKKFLLLTGERYLQSTYTQAKQSSTEYLEASSETKTSMGSWTVKDSKLKDFSINDQELKIK